MRTPRTLVTAEADRYRWRIVPRNGRSAAGGVLRDLGDRDELVYTDPQGRSWYPYLIEFRSADGQFCAELWATGDEHAEEQLRALRETAALRGRVVAVMG